MQSRFRWIECARLKLTQIRIRNEKYTEISDYLRKMLRHVCGDVHGRQILVFESKTYTRIYVLRRWIDYLDNVKDKG